jgi:hypothetical protein
LNWENWNNSSFLHRSLCLLQAGHCQYRPLHTSGPLRHRIVSVEQVTPDVDQLERTEAHHYHQSPASNFESSLHLSIIIATIIRAVIVRVYHPLVKNTVPFVIVHVWKPWNG